MPPDAANADDLSLEGLLSRVATKAEVQFADVLRIIDTHYVFTPTAFENGLGRLMIRNASDQNQGSCRVFAFGRLHGLGETETLACFGEHYRQVLANPQGTDHGNIRRFMESGWPGVHLPGEPLSRRTAPDQ